MFLRRDSHLHAQKVYAKPTAACWDVVLICIRVSPWNYWQTEHPKIWPELFRNLFMVLAFDGYLTNGTQDSNLFCGDGFWRIPLVWWKAFFGVVMILRVMVSCAIAIVVRLIRGSNFCLDCAKCWPVVTAPCFSVSKTLYFSNLLAYYFTRKTNARLLSRKSIT